MDILKKIEVYGDSILKGVILDRHSMKYTVSGAYAPEVIESELPCAVQNHSKFGCTIEKGQRILYKALEKGKVGDIVLLEYGGNDCDYNWKEVAENPDVMHYPHTLPEVFERIYKEIIAKIKEIGARPVVMTLPPIDAVKYYNWIIKDGLNGDNIKKFIGDVQHIYHYQEMYSDIAMRTAYETNTPVINVRRAFLDSRNFNRLICDDGIHPTEEGQGLIRETLIEFGRSRLPLLA